MCRSSHLRARLFTALLTENGPTHGRIHGRMNTRAHDRMRGLMAALSLSSFPVGALTSRCAVQVREEYSHLEAPARSIRRRYDGNVLRGAAVIKRYNDSRDRFQVARVQGVLS